MSIYSIYHSPYTRAQNGMALIHLQIELNPIHAKKCEFIIVIINFAILDLLRLTADGGVQKV